MRRTKPDNTINLVQEIAEERFRAEALRREGQFHNEDAIELRKLEKTSPLGKKARKTFEELQKMQAELQEKGLSFGFTTPQEFSLFFRDPSPRKKTYREWYNRTRLAIKEAILEARLDAAGFDAKALLTSIEALFKL
jgi:hypothetical protein